MGSPLPYGLCRNPLFKGSTVAWMIWLFPAALAPTAVAIPCSKGLLLHAYGSSYSDSLVYVRSQSPVQRVYCCMKLMKISSIIEKQCRNPLFKGSTVAWTVLRKELGKSREKSQSPVQRVYCCMLRPRRARSDETRRSRNPLFKGSTVACP